MGTKLSSLKSPLTIGLNSAEQYVGRINHLHSRPMTRRPTECFQGAVGRLRR